MYLCYVTSHGSVVHLSHRTGTVLREKTNITEISLHRAKCTGPGVMCKKIQSPMNMALITTDKYKIMKMTGNNNNNNNTKKNTTISNMYLFNINRGDVDVNELKHRRF